MPAARPPVQPAPARLRPPRLGRVFARERLFADLDAASAAPGLWLAGPPGAGKTTLVATYLDARGTPALWLQLDAGDADPAGFTHALWSATGALPGPHPRIPPPPTADDLRDVPAFLRRTLRRLAQALPPPWALVLDNVQDLGDAAALHAGLAAALAELPAGARLVAVSRAPPPAAYARALANQQLACIDAPALRFTADEATALIQLHGGSASAAALCDAADGWAAAMILMLAAPQAAPRLPDDLAESTRQRVFDLIAGEVLDHMDPAAVAALSRVAFLPTSTAAMAAQVSGDGQAGDWLDDLARRSLFTDRRDGPVPSYSFHALFGECLRSRAAATLAPPALRQLRCDAAATLVGAGQVEAAWPLLVQAQSWDAALDLVLTQAAALTADGRTALLAGWLQALPEPLREAPAPSYWLGMALLATDPAAALCQLERAHAGYARDGDDEGAFRSACAAADAIVFVGANYDALAPWMPVLERHAGVYLAKPAGAADLRILPGLLAAFVNRDPGHPLTAPLADAAERLLDLAHGASQRLLLGTLAFYLLWTGQTPRLDRILRRIDHLRAQGDAAPATLLRWYGVSVLIRSLLGRIDEAQADAARARALTAAAAPPMRVKAELMAVLAALAARDADAARRHLADAAGLLAAGNPIDVTTHDFQRGMLMLLDADWAGAAQLMRAAVPSGRDSGWPLREHIALLGQALAATQVDALDEAEAALQAALTHRFHAVCRWHHWIAGLIEAHLAERKGERGRALAALAGALATGRACGFDFGPMPFCCGDMMSRLAALALAHGIDPPYVQHIVRRHALAAPPGAVDAWPWPVRIRTLGRFALERDGEPAPAPRKESRKPLELLKLLVALGGQAVPVARLCASLWPEAPGDAARNSFDHTLHRLRKLLGGETCLLLQGAALSLNAGRCWTDLAALDAELADAEALAMAAPPTSEQAAALVDRILALYQGDFLAGEDGTPELLAARERLQARFTRQIGALGAALEAGGERVAAARLYQRVLEQQPLAEDIVRRLIACLLAMGQRSEALEAYRRCRQQLSLLLGLRPSAETEALVAGLRDL